MKKVVFIIAVVFLICGCAAQQVVREREKNSRIVYRDLTKPIFYPVPKPDAPINPVKPQAPQKPQSRPAGYRSAHFVEFANDSTRRFDKEGLQSFIGVNDTAAHILVIGHSHGNSEVGTLRLASKRAQTVAQYLTQKGYVNVHAMASWGAAPVWFAPNRGVHIYVIGKNPDPESAPSNVTIIFAKQVLQKDLEEKPNESPQDFTPIADFAAQNGLDGI